MVTVPVAQWFQFPGNTHTDEKQYILNALHCKSLWIKASAKCINVNVLKPRLLSLCEHLGCIMQIFPHRDIDMWGVFE